MKKLLLITVIMLLHGFLFAQFPGTALEFDGVDEYVNCGNDVSLDITDSITIEAWINANSWETEIWEGTIVGKDNTDHTGYNLRCGENGRLSFVNGITGTWPEVQSSQIMSTNEWYHVAGVYDGTSQKIYIDGELVGENPTTGTIGVNTNNLQIGDSQGYPGRLFDGKIDEVRIWNVARTEVEINDNMYNSLVGTETGLVAYYELDEGTGTIAGDSAGSNNGTLTNMEEADWIDSSISPSPSIVTLTNPGSFTLVIENFNGINVGNSSVPTFSDFDGDGLLDMLIGESSRNINHYEQDSPNSTSFTIVTENFNGIDVGMTSAPTFTDLDGDGLLDMLIGNMGGAIHHYEQDAVNSTSFTFRTNSFNSIDVGSYSRPAFSDFDGDGLLDMLIGENSGEIYHYEQNTLNSTLFTLVTTSFNGIDLDNGPAPTFADLDGDSLLDLIIGKGSGDIYHYEQDSENSTSFTLMTESFNGIDIGSGPKPTFTDLDGDGLLDMLVGESEGNINHYEQDGVGNLDFGTYLVSSISEPRNYIAKASNLIGELHIDSPIGFKVSLSENTGYQSSLSLAPIEGSVSDTIFVRFEPTLEQEYIGNISHASTNMETKNIALSGTGAIPDTIPGTALEFDGVDDYVETSLNDLSGSAITIEYWFKGSSTQSAVRQQNGDFIVAGWEDKHIISIDGGVGGGIAVGAGAEDGNWHHIAMTWQQNTTNGFKSYLDGNLIEQRNSVDTPLPNIDANVYVGSYNGTGEFTSGQIEEVRIWNTARTTEEIRESINLPLTGSETGLVGYWQFNEGSENLASDIISGNHGTLTNMDDTDWVSSTIPFGAGSVSTQIISMVELVGFPGTDLSIDITEKTGIDTIVVTKIDLAPNINPAEPDSTFDSQYWVVNKYGNGSLTTDISITVSEDITSGDESNPIFIKLYTRSGTSDNNWAYNVSAAIVNATTNTATFTDITDFGQLIVTKDMISVPQNVTTEIIGSDMKLSWDAVDGAASYRVFASTDPYGTFTDFTNFGTLNELSWDLSWSGDKLFFYVIAVSGTKVITKSIKSNKTTIKLK